MTHSHPQPEPRSIPHVDCVVGVRPVLAAGVRAAGGLDEVSTLAATTPREQNDAESEVDVPRPSDLRLTAVGVEAKQPARRSTASAGIGRKAATTTCKPVKHPACVKQVWDVEAEGRSGNVSRVWRDTPERRGFSCLTQRPVRKSMSGTSEGDNRSATTPRGTVPKQPDRQATAVKSRAGEMPAFFQNIRPPTPRNNGGPKDVVRGHLQTKPVNARLMRCTQAGRPESSRLSLRRRRGDMTRGRTPDQGTPPQPRMRRNTGQAGRKPTADARGIWLDRWEPVKDRPGAETLSMEVAA